MAVKKIEITYDLAIDKLKEVLKKPLDVNVRDITDEFVLNSMTEVYAPVFEARLIGPKKKIGLIRIDAVRNRLL